MGEEFRDVPQDYFQKKVCLVLKCEELAAHYQSQHYPLLSSFSPWLQYLVESQLNHLKFQ